MWLVYNGCWFRSGEGQNTKIYMNILTVEVGIQTGIPRNQISSIIRTNGCTINVDTKKDETNVSESFVCSVEQKTKGGGEVIQVIELKEIVIEGYRGYRR